MANDEKTVTHYHMSYTVDESIWCYLFPQCVKIKKSTYVVNKNTYLPQVFVITHKDELKLAQALVKCNKLLFLKWNSTLFKIHEIFYDKNPCFSCCSISGIYCHPVCEPVNQFNEWQEAEAEAQSHESANLRN